MLQHENPSKKINAYFFKSEAGNEPVKDLLKELGKPIRTLIGDDLAFVEVNWRVDRPYVDRREAARASLKKQSMK